MQSIKQTLDIYRQRLSDAAEHKLPYVLIPIDDAEGLLVAINEMDRKMRNSFGAFYGTIMDVDDGK